MQYPSYSVHGHILCAVSCAIKAPNMDKASCFAGAGLISDNYCQFVRKYEPNIMEMT